MSKRVAVAYVVNDLLFGDAQVAVLAIAARLDRERFEPTVYFLHEFPEERPNLKAAFARAGIRMVHVETESSTLRGRVRSLAALFAKERPDIVHTHLIDATLVGMVSALLSGVRTRIIHEYQTHSLYGWKVRVAYAFLRPFATLTICYSPVVEGELFGNVSVLSTPPEKLKRRSYTIYNGVDLVALERSRASDARRKIRQELSIPEEAVVIASVARLIPWKGQRTLLEAFAVHARSVSTTHLVLVGEGYLYNELAARAVLLGLAGRVHMTGAREDVYDILSASDLASLALTYENDLVNEAVGLSGFEAMGSGLPLIASSYPSAKLCIEDRVSGVLVPPGDKAALADALTELSQDAAGMRERIGAQGAAFVREHMDWQKLIPCYERLYALMHTEATRTRRH